MVTAEGGDGMGSGSGGTGGSGDGAGFEGGRLLLNAAKPMITAPDSKMMMAAIQRDSSSIFLTPLGAPTIAVGVTVTVGVTTVGVGVGVGGRGVSVGV